LNELIIQPHVESILAVPDVPVPPSSASFLPVEDPGALLATAIHTTSSLVLEPAHFNMTCEPLPANVIDDLLTMDIEEIPTQENYQCNMLFFYDLLDRLGDSGRSDSSPLTLVQL
jgi:hypothetical protein